MKNLKAKTTGGLLRDISYQPTIMGNIELPVIITDGLKSVIGRELRVNLSAEQAIDLGKSLIEFGEALKIELVEADKEIKGLPITHG